MNPFGNVEVMEGCQLPIGTVYLNFPRIVTAAKAAGVEYAQAVVRPLSQDTSLQSIELFTWSTMDLHEQDGFRFTRAGTVPNFKGVVVLEKDREVVLEVGRKKNSLLALRIAPPSP